ncbi:uncharacterized protein NECHADRAFT_78363 [Fusarium vanettenii 77-13-4]|uniref:Uncharacterized protein n=1 Tax=Fusarium vanettenii (strain ATCC MYA-4622 / CBS 123669 / FGSC 9596 / NRRL 45880 / 77-13-4) TaxID=660122 RepID=C7ZFL4_FUSV7|nr:uncharacterized protein NECHADRAFT_78363 [Fusarium vanettenii 77-13-4]EEU37171.1 predicted protein [Fusarium vanettenii 77-13-4]
MPPANRSASSSSRPEFGSSVELSLSTFIDESSTIGRTLAVQLIVTFNKIKKDMERSLARELAEFLPKAWEQFVSSNLKGPPTEHDYYKRMQGIERSQKELYYPYWFFLAAAFGVYHPTLAPIRKDMEALWGVQFPDNYIHWPPGIPTERQKALFHGGPENPTPLCKIQRRAQGFKAAIQDAGRPSVIEAVTQYAPALLNQAVSTGDVESLHRKLKDTQEQLQKTQAQLQETQKRLRETSGELEKTRKKLKTDIETSNKELAATNLRVDKVVDTCALVLSILAPPGGEK